MSIHHQCILCGRSYGDGERHVCSVEGLAERVSALQGELAELQALPTRIADALERIADRLDSWNDERWLAARVKGP